MGESWQDDMVRKGECTASKRHRLFVGTHKTVSMVVALVRSVEY